MAGGISSGFRTRPAARPLFLAARELLRALRRTRGRILREAAIRRYLAGHSRRCLQLGAGFNLLEGWLNTDSGTSGGAVVYLDARHPFPLRGASFDFVFSEHQIEHLRQDEGLRMLRESLRVLRPGGWIRLSTPDLTRIAYLLRGSPDDEGLHYLNWVFQRHIADEARQRRGEEDTGILGHACADDRELACRVLNNLFRNWGHRFIYDESTLRSLLENAGFTGIRRCAPGASEEPELRSIDSHGREIGDERVNRFESLILEARKPADS